MESGSLTFLAGLRSAWTLILALVVCTTACATRAQVAPQAAADRLRERTGATARVSGVAAPGIPAGIRLDDGLTADEAVAIALWNNAAFQVSVSDLGFARADLLDAGMLTNPVLSLLLPAGPKQLEATLRWPLEVLWERPRRMRMATLAADAAAQRLVQAGLDLVQAVRIAHTDLALALDRQRLAGEVAGLLTTVDTLTQSRLSAGDISPLEAGPARVDAARGQQDAARAVHDVAMARARLRLLLGLTTEEPAFDVTPAATPVAPCGPTADLLREALVARPDVRAAELGVEAAGARLGWERSRVLALTAVLDANGQGREGFEAGPGVDVGLPLFNRNQGGRARAGADLQRSSAAYAAIQQQVALEIREATSLFDQAVEHLGAWRSRVIEPLQANLTDAEQAFAAGDTSQLPVLDHRRRLTDARLRERELAADAGRARSRIERAVGRSCTAPSQEASRDR